MNFAVNALNHLLRQNTWATERLRACSGKTINLALVPLELCVAIEANGELAMALPGAIPDAGIKLTPFAALGLLAGQGRNEATLEGDTELAITVGKVLQQLQWEYEEDLSQLIGDIPAHTMVNLSKQVFAEGQRQLLSLAGMFAEYWLEERPLIATSRDLVRFSAEVDALRDSAERFTKRLERVEKGF